MVDVYNIPKLKRPVMDGALRRELTKCRRMDGLDITTVIVLNLTKGAGSEEDPVRPIQQYWSMDGKFLFELDFSKEQEIRRAYEEEFY